MNEVNGKETRVKTMKASFLKISVALTLIMACGAAFAQTDQDDNPGSLWPNSYQSPLRDRTAHRVGDVITIVINENTAASWAASTSTSKADSTTIPTPSLPNIPIIGGLFKALGVSANSSTSGTGSTTQAGKLNAKMTCLVKEVMPNGNLIIEGTRFVRVNKDTQAVTLTGVVRREDVQPDNTVLSEKIANAEIRTDGKGQISDRQRRGILTRLLDWLF